MYLKRVAIVIPIMFILDSLISSVQGVDENVRNPAVFTQPTLQRQKRDCCDLVEGVCKDGSFGTPYCGNGPCNMFGCNCEGGCRDGQSSHKPLPSKKFIKRLWTTRYKRNYYQK